jgi:hypothetical protein
VDGIVRTQASRLRSRLQLYFQTDGANEPVQIEIPRGGYVPYFESRALRQAERDFPVGNDAVESLPVPQNESSKGLLARTATKLRSSSPIEWIRRTWVPWVLVAILLLACFFLGFKLRYTNRNGSASAPHPLWNTIFAANQHTLIVYGDSGLVMWKNYSHRDVHLAEYLGRDYLKLPAAALGNQAMVQDLGGRRYTSIVDLEIAETMQQLGMVRNASIEHHYARDLRPNDLKQGNVILIGAAEANPWVELFEVNMNFYFHNDRVKQVFSIMNRAPVGDEPKQWDSAYHDPAHRVYAVVAYLPNLSGQGNALLLEGTSMAGTESAWDFVSDDSQFLPFLQRIRRPDGTIPHFEVILGTKNVNGSAGKNLMLAWRTSR